MFVPDADPEVAASVAQGISSLDGVTKSVEVREFTVDSLSVNGRQDQSTTDKHLVGLEVSHAHLPGRPYSYSGAG